MGSKDERSDRERWLEWAKHSMWTFTEYYKYTFYFRTTGRVLSLPDGAGEDVTATLSVGGDSSDIYRYQVGTEPMTWTEATCGGDWDLRVTTVDGTEKFSTYGDIGP